ncbi:MAG: AAA family ATPase [Ruminococcus sp.]|nr:AAA family ATPase [Ruminococcus sp.]
MGIPVLILGESGSGKSTSLRNFEPSEIGIFNVASKPLPFRKKLPKMDGATYQDIERSLSNPKLKTYVIDDSQYLLAFEFFDRAKETGYNKFTDIALRFRNMIQFIITQTPPDVIVYLLHHTERTDDGHVKAKTIGRMLDEKLTVEGLFSIVLMAQTDGKEHWFLTQNDGYSPVKTPMEMFATEKIDNDLKAVDDTIRAYYELNNN